MGKLVKQHICTNQILHIHKLTNASGCGLRRNPRKHGQEGSVMRRTLNSFWPTHPSKPAHLAAGCQHVGKRNALVSQQFLFWALHYTSLGQEQGWCEWAQSSASTSVRCMPNSSPNYTAYAHRRNSRELEKLLLNLTPQFVIHSVFFFLTFFYLGLVFTHNSIILT